MVWFPQSLDLNIIDTVWIILTEHTTKNTFKLVRVVKTLFLPYILQLYTELAYVSIS